MFYDSGYCCYAQLSKFGNAQVTVYNTSVPLRNFDVYLQHLIRMDYEMTFVYPWFLSRPKSDNINKMETNRNDVVTSRGKLAKSRVAFSMSSSVTSTAVQLASVEGR